jgi:hypothetical protein
MTASMIFDGIEFNERMRWTDVLGDVGFLAMDLDDRGLPAHANRFLNNWFEHTGDVSALPLLDFYRAYRAMVRAKIAALRLSQELAAAERDQVLAEYHSYTDLAERYTRSTAAACCASPTACPGRASRACTASSSIATACSANPLGRGAQAPARAGASARSDSGLGDGYLRRRRHASHLRPPGGARRNRSA